jgi:hypothetical protein
MELKIVSHTNEKYSYLKSYHVTYNDNTYSLSVDEFAHFITVLLEQVLSEQIEDKKSLED